MFRHIVKVTGSKGSYHIEVDTDYERNEAHPLIRVTVESVDEETGELIKKTTRTLDF